MTTQTAPRVKPTVSKFKRWAKDVQPAAKAVLMARVFAQMERERVDAYIKPIFDSYKFTYAAKWAERYRGADGLVGLIPSPKDLYLCDETGMALFYEDCDEAHRAHGFTGPKGHCPALTAEHLVIQVENELIKLAQPLFGIENHNLSLDDRKNYLELLIGSCFAKDNR